MTEKHKKILRRAYFALVTVALLVAAVCLMVACVAIYRTGDHPFTREAVALQFDTIAIPVYLCLGLVAVGFVLHPLLPTADEADPDRDSAVLTRMQARTDLALCPAELAADIRRQRKCRTRHHRIALGLFMLGAAVFLCYALDIGHFHQSEINASMIAAMWVLLPCMAVPFAYGVFSAYYARHSRKREIDLLRQAPAEAKISPAPAAPQSQRWLTVVRCALLVLGVGLTVGGLVNGGWMDVLTKAINICTECIGLG